MPSPIRARLLRAAFLLAAGGCTSDPSSLISAPDPDPGLPFTGLVADPTFDAGADPLVAYVSIAPGAMPNGVGAFVENRRTHRTIAAQLANAGFDPVAIGARAGDTIVVTYTLSGGGAERRWGVVPASRRPAIVRSTPTGGNVPLNASITIVFSEPIDARSLTGAIALRREGELVSGTIEVLPQQPWIARFTPATQLADASEFELAVTDQLRDLDGDRLESSTTVSFTTVIISRPGEGRIAFSTWSAADGFMIYTMDPNGTGLAKVASGFDPAFSPDGSKIAFWRYVGSGGVIYVANVDGSNVSRLTDGAQPTWSPDGRQLAYGCGGICIINADGSGLRMVTPPAPTSVTADVCIRDTDPTWSPNGTTIAFTRWPDARIPTSMCLPLGAAINFPFDFWTSVYMVELDGSNLRPVKDGGAVVSYAGWPAWSPNGKQLAFFFASGSEERILVADAEGLVTTSVARRSPVAWENTIGSPAWSPDGRRILIRTSNGWGFADASGSGAIDLVTSPTTIAPYSLSWSWSR